MTRQEAEAALTACLRPIFGFTLKHCRNVHDAEDLSQEIAARAFRGLLIREDVRDAGKFIWTVAHNALSNYYRDMAKSIVGVSADSVAEQLSDPFSALDDAEKQESLRRLQTELAYLSELQRKIVIAYYFDNWKQADIARELGIPTGTVKWHLFEAKKELKRGMNTMRNASDLKFNPIRFHSYGINGAAGTKPLDEFFRSALSQNICYCARNTAKTVNEIADDLGVSPVYVESEAGFLEKYGFLSVEKGKFLLNFLISEPDEALLIMQNAMYKRAGELFANELYDELTASGLLENPDIVCRQTDGPILLTEDPETDRNFLLWTLIPYIAACSGENPLEEQIPFDEVATIRPDGGCNIVHASVLPDRPVLPEDYVYMKNWCGPMWNDDGAHMLWQIDSEWSGRDLSRADRYAEESRRVLSLYAEEEAEGRLSRDDYTWLSERGYIKTNGDYDGLFKASWQIVLLKSRTAREKLLAVGERIREKHKTDFDALKAPYAEAALRSVPAHLRRIRAYELQFVFHSDGWFLLHCVKALLKNGRLKAPTEGQKKALTTLITVV